MTAFCGAQAIVTPTSNISSTAIVILVYAFNSGASSISTAMIQLGVPHEFIGIASGVVVCARTTGGAVATTIYSSILANKLQSGLTKDVALPLAENGVSPTSVPAVIEVLLSGDATSAALTKLSPTALLAAIMGLKTAYADAFRLVYLVSIAFGVVATVIVAFCTDVDHLLTRKVDTKLEQGAHVRAHTDTGAGHIIHMDEFAHK